jgi:hypothetical protein
MNASEDKKFGLALFLALSILAGIFGWRGHQNLSWGFGLAGFLALLAALSSPGLMKYPRKLLQAVGWLNGQLILTLVFYLVFGPVSLVSRISGRDPLGRKWKNRKESYWKPRPQPAFDPDRLQKQY